MFRKCLGCAELLQRREDEKPANFVRRIYCGEDCRSVAKRKGEPPINADMPRGFEDDPDAAIRHATKMLGDRMLKHYDSMVERLELVDKFDAMAMCGMAV